MCIPFLCFIYPYCKSDAKITKIASFGKIMTAHGGIMLKICCVTYKISAVKCEILPTFTCLNEYR